MGFLCYYLTSFSLNPWQDLEKKTDLVPGVILWNAHKIVGKFITASQAGGLAATTFPFFSREPSLTD